MSIGQFTIAGYALAQFAFAWDLIAQIGLYFERSRGQMVSGFAELVERIGSV